MADEIDELMGAFEGALKDATEHVVLVTGTDGEDRPFWAFVRMTQRSWEAFQDADGGDLAEFGTILDSGEGRAPPRSVRARMRRQFGFREG